MRRSSWGEPCERSAITPLCTQERSLMPKSDIATKARLLIARRSAPNSVWFYVSRDWRRHLLFLVIYVAIPVVLWQLDFAMLAGGVACLFAGAKLRDVRWYVALTKEWPTTMELLDWSKVETIANGNADPPSVTPQ
jgi:hypothetical protein